MVRCDCLFVCLLLCHAKGEKGRDENTSIIYMCVAMHGASTKTAVRWALGVRLDLLGLACAGGQRKR